MNPDLMSHRLGKPIKCIVQLVMLLIYIGYANIILIKPPIAVEVLSFLKQGHLLT